MRLIDSHCHIHDVLPALHGDDAVRSIWLKANLASPEDLIRRAKENGVIGMVCIGTNASDSKAAVQFAKDHHECYATIGLHPHEAREYKQEMKQIVELASEPKVVAIGECGLDYHYLHSSRDHQRAALLEHLKLAAERNLPLVFHVRDAFDDFWEILDDFKEVRGVIHSFSDTAYNLDKAISKGLMIGLNGLVTFIDNNQLKIIRRVPLSRLLLETDAPFLTPVPLRGKINEPANILLIAKFLSGLMEVEESALAAATEQNARDFFAF